MIRSQKETGYQGLGILPYDASETPYMSEEYMMLYEQVLKTARDCGMKICLYDEWWFPSGSAGEILKKRYPEACAKRLDKEKYFPDSKGVIRAEIKDNTYGGNII